MSSSPDQAHRNSLADFNDYQHGALAFGQRVPRWYFAARAGAGKTAVALALMDWLMFDTFETDAVLVVAPKRVALQWADEARKWTFGEHLRFAEYVGPPKVRAAALDKIRLRQANVLVCSFEFFPELVKLVSVRRWPFGLVVFDEAMRLRNGGQRGSITWKAMNAVSRKTQSRLLLMGGSPRPGTAHELFAPVMLLDQGQRLGTTLTKFRQDYLEPDSLNRHTNEVYSWRLRPGMEAALYGRIADLYYVAAPDLGLEYVELDREVQVPAEVAAAIRTLQRGQVVEFDDIEVVAGSAGVAAGKIHQMCQGAVFAADGSVEQLHDVKLDELERLLAEAPGNVIVAYHYTHDQDRLLQRFPHAVDLGDDAGLTKAKQGRVRLALLHPKSAAHGIDGLQFHFDTIVWFTVTGTWELYDQANKRIVRRGRSGPVQVYRIIATNGVADPRLIERLHAREREEQEFFDYLEGVCR